jgi:hypothetical protein
LPSEKKDCWFLEGQIATLLEDFISARIEGENLLGFHVSTKAWVWPQEYKTAMKSGKIQHCKFEELLG